mmetsp:Transcript_15044/g.46555  ORF Transcript_15044/g.46555 Transcript_15044/m.46555 type:complete len:261 (+) Transcript_15044:1-783(+)
MFDTPSHTLGRREDTKTVPESGPFCVCLRYARGQPPDTGSTARCPVRSAASAGAVPSCRGRLARPHDAAHARYSSSEEDWSPGAPPSPRAGRSLSEPRYDTPGSSAEPGGRCCSAATISRCAPGCSRWRHARKRRARTGWVAAVQRHTSRRFHRLQKFCVTAMVSSRFNTVCHHRAGTNTTSPGSWTNSTGRCSSGHCLARRRAPRHQSRNQQAAESSPRAGCGSGRSRAPGLPGGKSTQSLAPLTSAFQAEVPSGSLCR